MIPFKPHLKCRVCNSEKLTEYLDLGMMPLSNNLAATKEESLAVERLPLKVLLCEDCGLSQLSIIVDPETLFGNYTYRSSINKGYVTHCREMAKYLKKKYKLNQASKMIDIAGNDCALLKEFREEIGLSCLNVDPAKNLQKICVDKSIPAVCEFWGYKAAEEILGTEGEVDLITATNVFAHVDRVDEFIGAAKKLLKPDGILVIEFPYFIDFVEQREFDTVYFEHLSYFSIYPLDLLCEKFGLDIFHVEKHPIHGGTVRIEIGHKSEIKKRDYTVSQAIRNEREKFSHLGWYRVFSNDVKRTIHEFRKGIKSLSNVAGFAASAKGNTLLNCSEIKNEIKYIVDETPEKLNKYSPGTGIKIVSLERLKKDPPDYLVVLSWNFFSEIHDKCRAFGYKGKFIRPIPEFEISD